MATPDPVKTAHSYFTQGEELFHAGRYMEALSKYQDAMSTDPSDIEVYLQLASCHLILGHHAETLLVCDEALLLNPASIDARLLQAKAYRSRGEFENARAAYGLALQLDDQYPATLRGFGCLLMATDDPAEGLALLERLAKLETATPTDLRLCGQALINMGLADEAVKPLTISDEMQPDDALTLYALALACHKSHDQRKAEELLRHLLEREGSSARAHYLLGEVLKAQSDGRGSRQHFERAEALDRKVAHTYLLFDYDEG